MVLKNITYFNIFGIPLIAYGGVVTLGFIIATAYTGSKQKPIKVHKTLAGVSIALGAIHGLLAILAYF
ncbi:hypothetical protein KY345_03575 [Candidatus Woesearchaeota archaeon]|nr:hypothetical protein [Candidatus Woesearchaeota archaeon]